MINNSDSPHDLSHSSIISLGFASVISNLSLVLDYDMTQNRNKPFIAKVYDQNTIPDTIMLTVVYNYPYSYAQC